MASLGDLVARADAGDPAAKNALFATLYDELHRLARAHIHRGAGDVTLGATTLLHEAYLDIAQRDSVAFQDRHRFLAYASRAMRTLVIDYVRNRHALKRGGDLVFTTLVDEHAELPVSDDLNNLGAALDQLATIDAPLAELVDLKFFCGFSFAEIAAMRSSSERTIQRDWAKARALLHHMLEE